MVGCWLNLSRAMTQISVPHNLNQYWKIRKTRNFTHVLLCLCTALTALPQTMIYFVFVKHAIGQNNVFWFFVSFLWLLYLIYFMIYLCIKLSFH